MLPVDVVADLLMKCAYLTKNGWCHAIVEGASPSQCELREKIRSHLQSLVPPPKLLSECEEWDDQPVAVRCYRLGDNALTLEYAATIGKAKDFRVIQPVEVNRE